MDFTYLILICISLCIMALSWYLAKRFLRPFYFERFLRWFFSDRGGNDELEEIRQEMEEMRKRMDRQYADLTLMLNGARADDSPELETEQTAELRRAVKHEMAEMREEMDRQYDDLTLRLEKARRQRGME